MGSRLSPHISQGRRSCSSEYFAFHVKNSDITFGIRSIIAWVRWSRVKNRVSKKGLTSTSGIPKLRFMRNSFAIASVVVGLLQALVVCLVEGRAFTVANGYG